MKKEKQTRKKGISLIVLIITIVVIVILASAVILTIGNNNPIESAKKATYGNDIGQMKDQLAIEIGQKYLDGKGSFDITSLNGQKLETVITGVPEKYSNKFTVQNGEIRPVCDALTEQEKEWLKGVINTECGDIVSDIPTPNGGSIYTDANGVKVPIPAGYTVSTVAGENTVADGLVIKEGNDGAAADWDVNEFVWIPVEDITEMYDEATQRGKLYDFSSGRISTLKSDCLTTSSGDREPDVLPYDDGNSIYDTTGITKVGLQSEFNAMITSVKKYKGFYIGRYETGNINQTTPVIRKLNTDINYQRWYNMYIRVKNIVSNASGQTTIIWGCQWDEVLRWMNKDSRIGDYVTDGTGKGNYKDQTFTYTTNTSGATAVKELNKGIIIPTGSYEGAKVKNIYDMAGNEWEFTMEARDNGGRVHHGGCYGNVAMSSPVSSRSANGPTIVDIGIGVRVQLYLK